MKKPTYTIALNFFVSDEVVKNLKDVQVSGPFIFDWRKPKLAHCTVKAIYHGAQLPDPKLIETWAELSKPIISQQKPFEVVVEGVTEWKTAVVANVYSAELMKLHEKLFAVLPGFQPRQEDDNYHPHVSIARVRGKVEVVAPPRETFGKFKVHEIQLMRWGMVDQQKSKALYSFNLGK